MARAVGMARRLGFAPRRRLLPAHERPSSSRAISRPLRSSGGHADTSSEMGTGVASIAADRRRPAEQRGRATAASLVSARGLTRRFGARVVGPVDVELAAGERVALRGPSGSGKSTILRCLAGTLVRTTGEIRIGAHAGGTPAARALLGVLLAHERSFDLRLTGRANLLFFARLRHASSRRAAAAVAALEDELALGEFAGERVSRCSTGMIQQLAFARALLGEPAALLLDEPTRSLDTDAVGRLWDALARRPRTAVLLATHRDDDVERCDRAIELAP